MIKIEGQQGPCRAGPTGMTARTTQEISGSKRQPRPGRPRRRLKPERRRRLTCSWPPEPNVGHRRARPPSTIDGQGARSGCRSNDGVLRPSDPDTPAVHRVQVAGLQDGARQRHPPTGVAGRPRRQRLGGRRWASDIVDKADFAAGKSYAIELAAGPIAGRWRKGPRPKRAPDVRRLHPARFQQPPAVDAGPAAAWAPTKNARRDLGRPIRTAARLTRIDTKTMAGDDRAAAQPGKTSTPITRRSTSKPQTCGSTLLNADQVMR